LLFAGTLFDKLALIKYLTADLE